MLINITFAAILEKSSGGEFQARNSNGMVYPYSREVMNKPFQRRIQSPHSILRGLFLMLLKGFPSLCIVTRSSVLVAVGVLYMLLHLLFLLFLLLLLFSLSSLLLLVLVLSLLLLSLLLLSLSFLLFLLLLEFLSRVVYCSYQVSSLFGFVSFNFFICLNLIQATTIWC